MVDNNYSIADLLSASIAASKGKEETTLEKPNPVDVGEFIKAMSKDSKSDAHCPQKCAEGVDKTGAKGTDLSGATEGADKSGSTKGADKAASTEGVDETGGTEGDDKAGSADGEQMKKIMMMLMELLTMLTKMMKEESEGGDSDSSSKGADAVGAGSSSTPSAGKGASSDSTSAAGKGEGASKGGSEKGAKVENGNIVAENNVAAGDGQIPKPTEHKQSFELGGKEVTIGGDGSASGAEVQQTKDTLTNLYENSGSFKQMLDSSPNESFEVSVGKRDDNMSWGNADGRVFMNINNIKPDSGDGFEALTAHEFAHAGVNMQHGAEMKQFEQTAAKEA